MGYLEGFLVTARQHRLFGGKRVTTSYSGGRVAKKGKDTEGRDEKTDKPERMHGRHVLNRYEDGMEKCIGCELCAGVCPAKCIHVRGADNDPQDPTSPGERFGYVYEINYLRRRPIVDVLGLIALSSIVAKGLHVVLDLAWIARTSHTPCMRLPMDC